MTTTASLPGPDDRSLFGRLMDEFLDRARRGERPTAEEYAERHPGLAAEIRDVFPTLFLLEQFGSVAGTGPAAGGGTAPPRQLGEYLIIREAGRGGMGVVYEAVQQTLGRHVALKVLAPGLTRRPEQLERFRREAQAAAKLHYTNIVPVFAVGEQDGAHFYAMQFIRGQSLSAVLDELRGRPPAARPSAATISLAGPPADDPPAAAGSRAGPVGSRASRGRYFRNVAEVGAQVADALHHAHKEGVVHRDVKPSNLLLDARGTVWVTDFGLAKVAAADDLTATGDVLGTLAYMAPEQLDGRADARTDVYGLGVTLYELLTLRPAFRDDVKVRLIQQVRGREPAGPRAIDPLIPRDLETVVLKAMAKEPDRRYPSAADLADDLRRFAAGRAVLARRAGWAGQAWRWCKRNPVVAGLLAAVAGLLVAVAGVATASAVRLGAAKADTDRANDALRATLWDTYRLQAREARWGNRPGRRFDGLAALAAAAAIRPTDDLRHEAIACLSLIDLAERWGRPAPDNTAIPDLIDFTPDLAHYTVFAGDLIVCRSDTGAEVRRLPRADRVPLYARFSPDPAGRWLAVKFEQNQPALEVWDWRAGTSAFTATDPAPDPALDLSADGKTLAYGTRSAVRLVDLETRTVRELARGLPGRPFAVRFDPAGARLAVTTVARESGEKESVLVFDAATGRELARDPVPVTSQPCSAVWTPDGSTLAVGLGFDIYLLAADRGFRPVKTLHGHRTLIHALNVHPSGRLLTSRSWSDGITRVWDVPGGTELLRFDGHGGRFSPDGAGMAFRGGGVVGVWEVAAGGEAPLLFESTRAFLMVNDVCWLDEWGLLAVADGQGLRVWEPTARREFPTPPVGTVYALGYDAGRRLLYTGTKAGLFRWPVRPVDGGLVIGPPVKLPLPAGLVPQRLSIDAAGGVLICGSRDGPDAVLYDLRADKVAHRVRAFYDLTDVAISADGRWAAAGHRDNGYAVWDVATGKRQPPILAVGSGPVAFSPAESRLATCRASEMAVRDVATGAVVWGVPRPDTVSPMAVGYDPTGRTLAYVHDRAGVRLMTAAGEFLTALDPAPQPDTVSRLVYDRSGSRLAVASRFHGVRVWDLPAVRRHLRGMGLDWPGDLPDPPTTQRMDRVTLDPGPLAPGPK